MAERFKPSTKEFWSENNVDAAASGLSYEIDENFLNAHRQFRETVVDPAKITIHLPAVAIRWFANHKPPLEKSVNGHNGGHNGKDTTKTDSPTPDTLVESPQYVEPSEKVAV